MLKVYEDDSLICYYSGKTDLVARLPNIPGTIPFDHKFRARTNEETTVNNQFIGYAIAYDSDIVIVNEVGLQASYTPEKKFLRKHLNFSPNLKEHWLKNILPGWINRLQSYYKGNFWPEQWDPFVCKKCMYHAVCQLGSMEDKDRYLTTHFEKTEPWDVTKGLEGSDE
jgi:hypothetical protein